MSLKQQNTMKIQCDWVNDFTVVNFKSGHTADMASLIMQFTILLRTQTFRYSKELTWVQQETRAEESYKLTMARLTIIKKSE